MTPGVDSFAAPPGLARDPLSEIWGDLSDADGAGLLADIRAHGVRQPILVDLNKCAVVDGWRRYRMAAQAGCECPAIDVASWPAAEVAAAVQSSNRRRRHSSRKELLGAMARQRLTGEAAPSQTVEQEARFAGVTKRRYQQALQATREELGLAPPNSGGRPPSAAVQGDAEALDLERMLELQADTIEALVRAAGPATPYMPWASATGGTPCCDSVAGVKPGRAPGLPAPPGSWPNQWRPGGLRRKAAAWLDPPPR